MNKISKALEKGRALIPFIVCGDPDLETTRQLVYAMEAAGADMIELGIPFSDPTAEETVLQEANIRALRNRITTDDIFQMVQKLKETVKIPLVFMTYANVIFSYGAERFMSRCREVGIEGLILPDIPFEEREEFRDICNRYEIELIAMLAPAPAERVKMIAREAKGFLYCVSSHGVTENREQLMADIQNMVTMARTQQDIPCAVDCGITASEQAKDIIKHADAVIAGSAIVKLCGSYGTECVVHVSRFVKEVKQDILSA